MSKTKCKCRCKCKLPLSIRRQSANDAWSNKEYWIRKAQSAVAITRGINPNGC